MKDKLEDLRSDLAKERSGRINAEQKCKKYIGMSRTYWERWRWELQMRREAIIRDRTTASKSTAIAKLVVPTIDAHMLEDPIVDGEQKECFLGRGSFGIVRLQMYRDIKVPVKEMLPRTVSEDVTKEALILASLCHPYLPCLFGICLKEKPYRLIMQFHAIDDLTSLTLYQLLSRKTLTLSINYAGAQLVEAVHYLHMDADVLHNDITCNNILVTQSKGDYHIVLVDFGKATKIAEAKHYHLTETEQQEYIINYPQIAPEVIYGRSKQSIYSDMFAIGGVLYTIADHSDFTTNVKIKVRLFAQRCRKPNYFERPRSSEAAKFFELLSLEQ